MSVYLTVCRWVDPAFNADGPHYHFDIFTRNASILGWSDGSTESETGGEETADALWIAIIEVAAVVGRGRVETGCYFGFTPFGKTKLYDFAPFHGLKHAKLEVDRLC